MIQTIINLIKILITYLSQSPPNAHNENFYNLLCFCVTICVGCLFAVGYIRLYINFLNLMIECQITGAMVVEQKPCV